MNKEQKHFYSFFIILIFLLTSCASTSLKSSWIDNSYKGKPERVFIIGVAQSPTVRKIFENAFKMQLKPYGISGIPSYEILSYEEMFDRAGIVSKIKDLNIDTVLVARSVSKKTLESYDQAFEHDWYEDYKINYITAGYTYEKDSIYVESSLYELKSEKKVWSALTKTFMIAGERKDEKIKPFIELIIKKMREDDLFK